MIVITLADISTTALNRFSKLFAVCPDREILLWDSHKMLPMVAPDQPATLVENAAVEVSSLGASDLEPLYAAIRAADGARGIPPTT